MNGLKNPCARASVAANTDNAAASAPIVQSVLNCAVVIMPAILVCRLAGLRQYATVGERCAHEHAAVLAVPQRADGNRDLLARLERRFAPAAAGQIVRA